VSSFSDAMEYNPRGMETSLLHKQAERVNREMLDLVSLAVQMDRGVLATEIDRKRIVFYDEIVSSLTF
jgi:hypothetical protein